MQAMFDRFDNVHKNFEKKDTKFYKQHEELVNPR